MESTLIIVEYKGPINPELDEKIRSAMESLGAIWTGQGMNLIDGIRDITFKLAK